MQEMLEHEEMNLKIIKAENGWIVIQSHDAKMEKREYVFLTAEEMAKWILNESSGAVVARHHG